MTHELDALQACIETMQSLQSSNTEVAIETIQTTESELLQLLNTSAKQIENERLLTSTSLNNSRNKNGEQQRQRQQLNKLSQRRRALKARSVNVIAWSQQQSRLNLMSTNKTDGRANANANATTATATTPTSQAQQMVKSLNRSKIVVQEILESTVAANSVLDEDAESLEATGRVHGEYGSTMSKASERLAEMKRLEELANTRMKWSFRFFVCVWIFVMVRRLPFLGISLYVAGSVVPWMLSFISQGEQMMICPPPSLSVPVHNFIQSKWPLLEVSNAALQQDNPRDRVCASLVTLYSADVPTICGGSLQICHEESPLLRFDLRTLCDKMSQPPCSILFTSCCGDRVSLSGEVHNFTLDRGGTGDTGGMGGTGDTGATIAVEVVAVGVEKDGVEKEQRDIADRAAAGKLAEEQEKERVTTKEREEEEQGKKQLVIELEVKAAAAAAEKTRFEKEQREKLAEEQEKEKVKAKEREEEEQGKKQLVIELEVKAAAAAAEKTRFEKEQREKLAEEQEKERVRELGKKAAAAAAEKTRIEKEQRAIANLAAAEMQAVKKAKQAEQRKMLEEEGEKAWLKELKLELGSVDAVDAVDAAEVVGNEAPESRKEESEKREKAKELEIKAVELAAAAAAAQTERMEKDAEIKQRKQLEEEMDQEKAHAEVDKIPISTADLSTESESSVGRSEL